MTQEDPTVIQDNPRVTKNDHWVTQDDPRVTQDNPRVTQEDLSVTQDDLWVTQDDTLADWLTNWITDTRGWAVDLWSCLVLCLLYLSQALIDVFAAVLAPVE